MKLETIRTKTTETFLQGNDFSVTVTPWGNCEGASVMVNGKDLSVKLAAAMRWEEIDMLIAALAVARATP